MDENVIPQKKPRARKEALVETYRGLMFDIMHPQHDMMNIVDIAHALSLQCRYGGHCQRYYSVAEHSVLVSQVLRDSIQGVIPQKEHARYALAGLMHDASEAYLVDMPTPVKDHMKIYLGIETKLMKSLFRAFNIKRLMFDDPHIYFADKVVLKKEASVLLPSKGKHWEIFKTFDDRGYALDKIPIRCLKPKQAEAFFLWNYYKLMCEIHNDLFSVTRKQCHINYVLSRVFGWFM